MQTINLYQAEFQPDRSPLRPAHMLAAAVVCVLLLLVFSVVYTLGSRQQAEGVNEREQQLARLQEQRDKLQSASARIDTESLDRRIEDTEAAIDYRRQLRNRMAEQSADSAPALSAQMRALAGFSNADFSLEGFALHDSGRYVEMQGLTRSRSALPAYLLQLQRVPAFADSRFGVLTLRETPAAGRYRFRIGPEEEDDRGE